MFQDGWAAIKVYMLLVVGVLNLYDFYILCSWTNAWQQARGREAAAIVGDESQSLCSVQVCL